MELNHKVVEEYILSMPESRLEYPFGEGVAVYKVFIPNKKPSASHLDATQGSQEERASRIDYTLSERQTPADTAMRQETDRVDSSAVQQEQAVSGDWKMFVLIHEKSDPLQVSLKCDPLLGRTLREKYESVMPGYHLNKKHWITIVLSGQLEWSEVQDLIRHSYELVKQ